jgi:Zn-dependent M28 family amino/carboxypeptidase
VELQPVPLNIGYNATLTANNKTIEAFAVTLAPGGTASGPLVAVPNLGCNASDFDGLELKSSVALIKRGTCSYGEKVILAAAAGAEAVIAWNNGEGTLEGYSLQVLYPKGDFVPVVGITMGQGEALLAQLQAGGKISVDLSTEVKLYETYNVIAETKAGDHENVIHVSGHSDSVTAGPGINDNGSGTISILEIAIQLTNFTVNNAVRFSWWTAEEAGLLG